MEPPTPPRAITLAFGDFSWKELQAEARAAGIEDEALIERAVAEFIRELSAEAGKRLSLEVPDATRGERSGKPVTVEVRLSAEQLSALEEEAKRQEVPVPRLVEHAAFHYLASEDADGETA